MDREQHVYTKWHFLARWFSKVVLVTLNLTVRSGEEGDSALCWRGRTACINTKDCAIYILKIVLYTKLIGKCVPCAVVIEEKGDTILNGLWAACVYKMTLSCTLVFESGLSYTESHYEQWGIGRLCSLLEGKIKKRMQEWIMRPWEEYKVDELKQINLPPSARWWCSLQARDIGKRIEEQLGRGRRKGDYKIYATVRSICRLNKLTNLQSGWNERILVSVYAVVSQKEGDTRLNGRWEACIYKHWR